MKTITVLTDFSANAENAARYALRLAQHLQANLTLYNSFLVPMAEPLGGQVYWSMEDYNILQKDSEEQLRALGTRLAKNYPLYQLMLSNLLLITNVRKGLYTGISTNYQQTGI